MKLFYYVVHDIFIESDIPLNFAFVASGEQRNKYFNSVRINYSMCFVRRLISVHNISILTSNDFNTYECPDGSLICQFQKDIFVHISRFKRIFNVDCHNKDIPLVSDYFVETFIPVCLLVSNYYVLHASCLSLNEKALLLCADSGTGKSTLAYKLYSKGWSVLSDDLICLLKEGKNYYAKGVFNMPLKLTRETIETFNVPLSINILPNDKTNKVNINNVSINSQQYILAAVCVLEPNDNNSEIEIVTHGKANALHHLLHHTSGLWGLNRVQKTNFILHCSTMVRSCPFIVFSLKYPKKTTVLDDPCSILSVHICQINGYKLGKEQE